MRVKQSTRARAGRAIVLPLMLTLTLATGLTLLGLAQLLAAGPIPRTADHASTGANLAVVRAFYAAANQTLRTGDPTGLNPLVAPNLIDHCPQLGDGTGKSALVQTLRSLHAGFPQAQLVVDDLVAQADEVVARVHLTGVVPGHFAGLVLPSSLAVWGELDLFRLAGGVIVEHWGDQPRPIELRPLQRGTLVIPGVQTAISAWRLTFTPAAAYTSNTWLGPRLLYVASGRLAVTLDLSYATWQAPAVRLPGAAGTPSAQDLISLGQTVTLGPSEALALPQGFGYSAQGSASGPAVCLEVALQLTAPFMAEEINGPQVQHLADNIPDPITSASGAIALGEMTLAPGATLPLATSTGSTLVSVESGQLDITMTGGAAWVQRGADGTTTGLGWLSGKQLGEPDIRDSDHQVRSGTLAPIVLPPATTLAARDTALVESGAKGVIRNAGDTPVSLLVVAFTPEQAVEGTPVAGPTKPIPLPEPSTVN